MSDPKGQFKVLTFNTFLRPPPVKNNEDDYKDERWIRIVEMLHQYDIVCLQEVFHMLSFRYEELILRAYAEGFHYWVGSEETSFFSGPLVDAGLVILSKFPIVTSQASSYGFGVLSDSTSDKGLLYAKINIDGQFLHLFNTHLQASYSYDQSNPIPFQVSILARVQQTIMLKQCISRCLAENGYDQTHTIILAGDFNINALKEPIEFTNSCFVPEPHSFNEYANLVEIMEGRYDLKPILHTEYTLIDFLLQNKQKHVPTFGMESNLVLTHKQVFGIPQRLDYIFELREKQHEKAIKAKVQTCEVEEFEVLGQHFRQLSDHLGISISFVY